jgi:hypothetical protein
MAAASPARAAGGGERRFDLAKGDDGAGEGNTDMKRPPDFIIGGAADPYLRRWWVIPRNRWFNIYLHHFMRSDDDRALHDHPWINVSILLRGSYLEHLQDGRVKDRKPWRPWAPWRLTFRLPTAAHRVELLRYRQVHPQHVPGEIPVWTLFITGPNVRQWGFLCPQGWRHWRDFTAGENGEVVGKGCD